MYTDPEGFDAIIRTKVGPVGISVLDGRVRAAGFPPEGTPAKNEESPRLRHILNRLKAYFMQPQDVQDVLLALDGTEFQRRVWDALCAIPSGSVLTYGELARRLGTAPRAVGGACRANPCPIFVPCHRVVAVHGRGGFAGASSARWIEIKEALLRHEGVTWPP